MNTVDLNELELTNKRLTRRKILSLMGVTGVALAETQTVAWAQQAAPVEAGLEANRIFNSIGAMQQDAALREGMLVRTLGYHAPTDGGGADYLVVKAGAEESANGGDIIALQPGLHARLLESRAVRYRVFGTVSDGKNDDGAQIKLAHEYANRHQIPVVNSGGEFWFKQTNNIPITTNVQWGRSIFHFVEQYNSKSAPRFRVLSDEKRESIQLDKATKAAILSQLKPGVLVIPELAPYTNCLVQVLDANDKIGFRAGYQGQAWSREELFYVEEHGRIIGDIAWEFKDYTQLNITPCSDHYLTIEGGGFYLSGDIPGEKYTGYYHCGIWVGRSRTIIRNQWMGLEAGKADVSMEARNGFYVLSHVYDVTLENIRLIPWEKNRSDPAKNVAQGTYGIGGGRMLNCTFRNVTAEGSLVHWGVFGTNVNKNFRIENCQFNRIDVHFHCWNLTISDSVVGARSISVTGGGHLWIENTVNHSNQFINFRSDYGAVWDGDIRISNCRLAPSGTGPVAILRNQMSNSDYGYRLGAARSVKVEDFIVDYSTVPNSTEVCWLMDIAAFSKTESGRRLFFPQNVHFQNVQIVGRSKGARLMQIQQPHSYDVGRDGAYDGVLLQPNARLLFENIQLEKMAPDAPQSLANVHFRLGSGTVSTPEDARALYPQIRIADCANLTAYLGGGIADVSFERCTINRLTAATDQPFKGQLAFENCRFLPEVQDDGKPFYALEAELGTSFTNCTVHAPRVGGQAKPELLHRIDFVQLNRAVRYFHLNTALGNDILRYARENNITLSPQFIAMLKAHHALESETVTAAQA